MAKKKAETKKTVIKLTDVEEEPEMLIFGLICHNRDYRLCREINLNLGLKLVRKEDYIVFSNKRMEDHQFSYFDYINENNDSYYLISNKCNKGFLLPEQSKIDYLLLVKPEMSEIDGQEILSRLKEIKMVLGGFIFDFAGLKSRTNLLF